jgi:hypothetical protein
MQENQQQEWEMMLQQGMDVMLLQRLQHQTHLPELLYVENLQQR